MSSLMAPLENQKATLPMVFIQLLYAGMALISKAALKKGMSSLVFVFYRQAVATLAMAPFAYILERENAPSLTLAVSCKIFLLALLGPTLTMDLFYTALDHTSATFASASINIIPVITFIIAILLRLETLGWGKQYGLYKIAGVILCTSGAAMLIFYQGPSLQLLHWHILLESRPGESFVSFQGKGLINLVKGPLLMFVSYFSWSAWIIMQAKMLKTYPAKLLLTTLQCLASSIQSVVIAVSFDRKVESWRLGWNLQLFSSIYCGIFVSGISYWLQLWCIEKKGPVFVAVFSPLSVIITAIASALLWAELLYLGSILGGVLIIGGVFCVLWGKSQELRQLSLSIVTCEVLKDRTPDV